MPMTKPCLCWPRARQMRGNAGSTYGTIDRFAAPTRRQCSITLATAKASIRSASGGHLGILRTDGYDQLYLAGRWTDPRSGVLGPCPAPVLCHG